MDSPRRVYGGVSASERTATRRAQLLHSCLEVVGREGVAGVTVEAVCADAGLGKRYFYEGFSTRDDLLDTAAAAFYADLLERTATRLQATDPEARIATAIEAVVDSLTEDPRIARLYAESPAVPVLAARRRLALEQLTALAHGLILGTDQPPSTGTVLMTRIVMSGATELVGAWLGGEVEASRDDVVAAIAALADVVPRRLT